MRYKDIANTLIQNIESGALTQGARMASLRTAAELHKVSLTTVKSSYGLLEELGWLIAKPQAGFFVSQPPLVAHAPQPIPFQSRLTNPATGLAKTAYANPHIAPGPLGISQIDPSLMPTEALHRSYKRGLKQLGGKLHQYPTLQGELALRQALSSHFSQLGFHFTAEDLIITNGCIDAVRIALEATTQAGDVVAISSPCFSGLIELLASLGRKVLEIPCVEQGIDLNQLEQQLARGAINVCLFSTSHMNPQGISLTPAQKQRLIALTSRYKIPLIEDDVYLELGFEKITPLPAKYWDKKGQVLWCGSISKTLSAGLRLGWCLPGKYFSAFFTHQSRTQVGVNTPNQLALADFIGTGQYRSHLQKMRHHLATQVRDYQEYLSQIMPANTAISAPTGGTVLWLQIPSLDSQRLVTEAQKQALDFRAGPVFTTLKLYRDCLRINVGWALTEAIKTQLAVLARLVKSNLSKIKSTS